MIKLTTVVPRDRITFNESLLKLYAERLMVRLKLVVNPSQLFQRVAVHHKKFPFQLIARPDNPAAQ